MDHLKIQSGWILAPSFHGTLEFSLWKSRVGVLILDVTYGDIKT